MIIYTKEINKYSDTDVDFELNEFMEEEAKKEYLKMIDEGELELCECATDDDWYCEEEEDLK